MQKSEVKSKNNATNNLASQTNHVNITRGDLKVTVTRNKLLLSKPTNIFDLPALSADLDLTIYAISALNAEKRHNGDR